MELLVSEITQLSLLHFTDTDIESVLAKTEITGLSNFIVINAPATPVDRKSRNLTPVINERCARWINWFLSDSTYREH